MPKSTKSSKRSSKSPSRKPISKSTMLTDPTTGNFAGSAGIGYDRWVILLRMAQKTWPKLSMQRLHRETGVSIGACKRAFFVGYIHQPWCPGPLKAVLDVLSTVEIETLLQAITEARRSHLYDALPLFELDDDGRGKKVGCKGQVVIPDPATYEENARLRAEAGRTRRGWGTKVEYRQLDGSWGPVKPPDSDGLLPSEVKSGALAKSSTAAVSYALPPDPSSMPLYLGESNGQVSTGLAPGSRLSSEPLKDNNLTPEDLERLRKAARRSGLDLSQFAVALRSAMLQELDMLAGVRTEALSTIKAFHGVAQMFRSRMKAFASKLREEEIKGWPSVKASDPEKELRLILSFLEIQKRISGIVDTAISAEKNRLGDAEAWKRRTDMLLFGSGAAGAMTAPANDQERTMTDEVVEDIAEWMGAPMLAEGVKKHLRLVHSSTAPITKAAATDLPANPTASETEATEDVEKAATEAVIADTAADKDEPIVDDNAVPASLRSAEDALLGEMLEPSNDVA